MKSNRKRSLFGAILVILSVGFVGYCHYAVIYIADTFIEVRRGESELFSELVRENWDGIKSISDEQKELLLENLKSELVATDIRLLRQIILALIYVIGIALLIQGLVVVLKVPRSKRDNKSLNSDASTGGRAS